MKIKSLKKITFFVPLIFILAGCGSSITDPQQIPIAATFDANNPAAIHLTMGGGHFEVAASPENEIRGLIESNTEAWLPQISEGEQQISITQAEIGKIPTIPSEKFINTWDLRFNANPLDLFIEARAYEGSLDLSDIRLRSFRFLDSVSQSNLLFSRPNPVKLETFEVGSSGSSLVLSGLSNANFEQLTFRGVGGRYSLDFSGDLQRDANVTIITGLGQIQLEVPRDIPATITIIGQVRGLEVEGDWISDRNVYTNPGTGHQLTVELNVDLGSIKLVLK